MAKEFLAKWVIFQRCLLLDLDKGLNNQILGGWLRVGFKCRQVVLVHLPPMPNRFLFRSFFRNL